MLTIEVNGKPLRVVSCQITTQRPAPALFESVFDPIQITSGHVEIDLLWQYANMLDGGSIRIYGGGDTLFEGHDRKSHSLTDQGDGRVVYEAEYERGEIYRVERREIAPAQDDA